MALFVLRLTCFQRRSFNFLEWLRLLLLIGANYSVELLVDRRLSLTVDPSLFIEKVLNLIIIFFQLQVFTLEILHLLLKLLFFDVLKFGLFQDLVHEGKIVLFSFLLFVVAGFVFLVRGLFSFVKTLAASLSIIYLVKIT